MKPLPPQFETIADLAWALVNDQLDEAGCAQLQELLEADADNRRIYLELMDQFVMVGMKGGRNGHELNDSPFAFDEAFEHEKAFPTWPQCDGLASPAVGISSDVDGSPEMASLPNDALLAHLERKSVTDDVMSHTPWSEYLVGGIISAVVMIGMGVGLWMWKVSDAKQVAHLQATEKPSATAASPLDRSAQESEPLTTGNAKPIFVGRITGEMDCQWKLVGNKASGARKLPVPEPDTRIKNQQGANAPRSPSAVCLGDRLTVTTGLLEVTFDAGSKVVLQGPCTFQVGTNGGYLAIGRLMGRLEKTVVSGQRTVDSAKPQVASPTVTPTPTSFVITTPTAVVTDLGTEFGVEVRNGGMSEVHVLKGMVEARFLTSRGKTLQTVELKAGEARHYDRASSQVSVIPLNRVSFARLQIAPHEDHRLERWKAYSERLRTDPSLVAYYPFELSARNSSTLLNASPAGSEMNAKIVGARWAKGRLPGKASLWFDGDEDRVELPHPERFHFEKAFSVAVWFQVHGFVGAEHALIAKGDIGWRLLQRSDFSGITFDTDSGPNGNIGKVYPIFGRGVIDDLAWHHVVAVYDSDARCGSKYLYIDGQLDFQGDVPLPLAQNNEPVWIGNNSQHPNRFLPGWIDEVAIFSRALSAAEVAAMHAAGDPASWPESVKVAVHDKERR